MDEEQLKTDELRPIEQKTRVVGEFLPAPNEYGENIVRFELFAFHGDPMAHDGFRMLKVASCEARAAELVNIRAMLGQVVGLPPHNCPHCHERIQDMPGEFGQMLELEAEIKERRFAPAQPEEPAIIKGTEADLNAIENARRRKGRIH